MAPPTRRSELQLIYTPDNVAVAYQLNWGLCLFWRIRASADSDWLSILKEQCEPAGLRILNHQLLSDDISQFFVSTQPHIVPAEIARGVKGRLQRLVRDEAPKPFQRNYDLHSIGSTQREKVENYVARQLQHHATDELTISADEKDLQLVNPEVDLGRIRYSSHSRFRCNLHIVFRFAERVIDTDRLPNVRQTLRRTAAKHDHELSRIGLLDDHVHLVLGFGLRESPLHLALPYMNNVAWVFGMSPVLRFSCFVGTCGEYDRGAVE
jgi:REP element-mobilizing transposase RayT